MADLTATQINTQLGVTAFDDNGGAGPLTLNMDVLTGDTLTLASGMAEPIYKTLAAASQTAVAAGEATDTYSAITRTIQTVNGVPNARYTATVAVRAPLNEQDITSIS